MSATLMGAVWTIQLSPPEQTVMLALADHANDDPGIPGYGFDIYPSVRLLAWKTGKTERQIQRILRTLENKRLIVPVAHARGGRNHPVCYEMHISNGVGKLPLEPLKGDIQGLSDEEIKGDIQGLSENNPLKGDIQGLKGDIQGLKGDIQGLKGDIAMSPDPSITIKNHQKNHHAHTREEVSAEKKENDAEPEPEADPPPASEPLGFTAWSIAYRKQHGYAVKTSKLMGLYREYRASVDVRAAPEEAISDVQA